jgi:hypothetical protein
MTHHPQESQVIRGWAQQLLKGKSLKALAAEANLKGVKTSSTEARWDGTKVRLVLQRASTAGLRIHQGELVGRATWEPILDELTYRRVCGIFRDPTRLTRDRGPLRRHLLSGILLCGKCGAPMAGRLKDGRQLYVCRPENLTPAGERGCGRLQREMAPIDLVIEAALLARLRDPRVQPPPTGPDPSPGLLDAIEELEQRLIEADEDRASGALDRASHLRISGRIQADIEHKRELMERARPSVLRGVAGPGAEARWNELKEAGALDEQRAIIREALPPMVLMPSSGWGFSPEDIQWVPTTEPN